MSETLPGWFSIPKKFGLWSFTRSGGMYCSTWQNHAITNWQYARYGHVNYAAQVLSRWKIDNIVPVRSGHCQHFAPIYKAFGASVAGMDEGGAQSFVCAHDMPCRTEARRSQWTKASDTVTMCE
jgi:hypothetical protein